MKTLEELEKKLQKQKQTDENHKKLKTTLDQIAHIIIASLDTYITTYSYPSTFGAPGNLGTPKSTYPELMTMWSTNNCGDIESSVSRNLQQLMYTIRDNMNDLQTRTHVHSSLLNTVKSIVNGINHLRRVISTKHEADVRLIPHIHARVVECTSLIDKKYTDLKSEHTKEHERLRAKMEALCRKSDDDAHITQVIGLYNACLEEISKICDHEELDFSSFNTVHAIQTVDSGIPAMLTHMRDSLVKMKTRLESIIPRQIVRTTYTLPETRDITVISEQIRTAQQQLTELQQDILNLDKQRQTILNSGDQVDTHALLNIENAYTQADARRVHLECALTQLQTVHANLQSKLIERSGGASGNVTCKPIPYYVQTLRTVNSVLRNVETLMTNQSAIDATQHIRNKAHAEYIQSASELQVRMEQMHKTYTNSMYTKCRTDINVYVSTYTSTDASLRSQMDTLRVSLNRMVDQVYDTKCRDLVQTIMTSLETYHRTYETYAVIRSLKAVTGHAV